ncbi:hypothetical protein HC761_00495 [bacterium]|nr:hypothetical protein [bacterium]
MSLGRLDAAEKLIAGLNVEILEAARSHGQWQVAIDGLQGLLAHQKNDRIRAKALLIAAEKGLRPERPSELKERFYLDIEAALAQY